MTWSRFGWARRRARATSGLPWVPRGKELVDRLAAARHDLDGAHKILAERNSDDAAPSNPSTSLLEDACRELGEFIDACATIIEAVDDSYVFYAELPQAKRRIGQERARCREARYWRRARRQVVSGDAKRHVQLRDHERRW